MGGRLPIERLAREPEPEADTSIILRVGRTVGEGVAAAVISALPGALRMGEEASVLRALEQWIVLGALGTPIAVTAVLVIKRARVGLHMLAGDRANVLALGVLWWSVIELGLLSLFGAVLRKTTHQHALAGVTFAAFAIVTGAFVGLLAKRTTSSIARGGPVAQKSALLVAGGAAFVAVMLIGVRTSRAEGLHTAAALVDVLALAVTSTVASSRAFDRYRPLAIAGVPSAIFILMVGFTTLRFDPRLDEVLPETAPVHAAMLQLVR
jgi:FtsH-binding integral membrane protein